MRNGSSVGMRTHCMHIFARLAPNLYAQSVLVNNISVSELSREFIKSAFVGWVLGLTFKASL